LLSRLGPRRSTWTVAACWLAAGAHADPPSARLPIAPETAEARLFLRYEGVPTMRHFGLVIGPDRSMWVFGGDNAAVGSDGFVTRVSAEGKEAGRIAFKTKFVGPGIDLGRDGSLYLACGDQVMRVSPAGQVGTVASGFTGAFDLRLDTRGNLFVADHFEAKIFRISADGMKTVLVDYHLKPAPFAIGGLAFDGGGRNLYSYAAATRTLWRHALRDDGTLLRSEVVRTDAPALFTFEIDRAGNVLGPDYECGELVMLKPDGALVRLTHRCHFAEAIGFRLGRADFHPGTAFVADNEGVKLVSLAANP
jgi:sugar lactone lactonase YvrE